MTTVHKTDEALERKLGEVVIRDRHSGYQKWLTRIGRLRAQTVGAWVFGVALIAIVSQSLRVTVAAGVVLSIVAALAYLVLRARGKTGKGHVRRRLRYTSTAAQQAKRASRLLDKLLRDVKILESLYVMGYRTHSRGGLEGYALDPDVPVKVRARALTALARQELLERNADGALERVQQAVALNPPRKSLIDLRTLEVDTLITAGQTDAAHEILVTLPVDISNTLRFANTYASRHDGGGDPHRQLESLNKVFSDAGVAPVRLRDHTRNLNLDNLATEAVAASVSGPLITVIMPAYNAADEIQRAARSILDQTWANLELIIVDDHSSDATDNVGLSIAESDARVTYVRQEVNKGAYAARNRGIALSRGDFITVHDSDDWSHAQKLEHQVQEMMQRSDVKATRSFCVRVDQDLRVASFGPIHRSSMIAPNMSSLMVRREAVDTLGVWDEGVRASGDSEYVRRLRAFYGHDAISDVTEEAPLSFALKAEGSLTSSSHTGYLSLKSALGARRQYLAAAENWHAHQDFESSLPVRPGDRPFVVPRLVTSHNVGKDTLDVIQMTDLHLPGGTTASSIQESRAQRAAGLKTGLVYHPVLEWVHRRGGLHALNPKVWDVIDGNLVRLLSAGEPVGADVLVVRFPRIAHALLEDLPHLEVDTVSVVLNHTPHRTYGSGDDEVFLDLLASNRNLEDKFGVDVVWYPNGPRVRQVLESHHAEELAHLTLADEDWFNIIDRDEWRRPGRPEPSDVVRIGRHSRDAREKWPETEEDVLGAYPGDSKYQIRILGGADSVLKRFPAVGGNWDVLPFDQISPRAFLADLDVYVYFTDSRWVEAFGRGLLEALAAGVPVITSPEFEPLFGAAALYCQPSGVREIVDSLMADPELYDRQVAIAHDIVDSTFAYSAHVARLQRAAKRARRS